MLSGKLPAYCRVSVGANGFAARAPWLSVRSAVEALTGALCGLTQAVCLNQFEKSSGVLAAISIVLIDATGGCVVSAYSLVPGDTIAIDGPVQPLLLPMVPDVVSVSMLPLLRRVNDHRGIKQR
jgi:hypothetical protein